MQTTLNSFLKKKINYSFRKKSLGLQIIMDFTEQKNLQQNKKRRKCRFGSLINVL